MFGKRMLGMMIRRGGIQRRSFSTNNLQQYVEQLDQKVRSSATFKDIQDLLEEMERRKYSSRRLMIISVLIVGYVSFDLIKTFTANQAADVTTKYLENEQFKADIVKFISSQQIEESVTVLLENAVVQIAQQQQVIEQLETLAKHLVSELLKSEVSLSAQFLLDDV